MFSGAPLAPADLKRAVELAGCKTLAFAEDLADIAALRAPEGTVRPFRHPFLTVHRFVLQDSVLERSKSSPQAPALAPKTRKTLRDRYARQGKAIEQPTMRLYIMLCVVLTESFHTPQNTARRRTLLKAETETKSPYEVLGVRTSAKPDEIRKAFREKAKSLHPDVVLAKSGTPETKAGDAAAKAAQEIRKFLDELDAESTREDLEKDLCAAAATLATLGDDRRAELEAREARRNAATKAWQTIVDAHDVLSNEKSRSDVDRKASAEAVGNAIGTLGGVAFIGLQNMGKMAAGAVGAAVEAGTSAVSEASKDDS